MHDVSAADYNAARDGSTDAAPALQKALDHLAGGGVLRVPPGTYRVGKTLRIGSHTRLELHPQARLRLADGAGVYKDSFLLTNADHANGNENIEIRGGIFDGNNRNNPRSDAGARDPLSDPGSYTGVLVNFHNLRHLVFADTMLTDSETYHFRAGRLYDFLVEDVRFYTTNPRPNNDGIHLGGYCERGIIRNLTGLGPGAPDDDLVALNADDAIDRIECQGKEHGPIRDLAISDLSAEACHTFVRVLSVTSPIERITISKIRGGCDQAVLNMDAARGCRVPLFDEADPAHADGVGFARDVRVHDVRCWKTGGGNAPMVRLETRTKNLVMTDVERVTKRDGAPDALSLRARFIPDHRLRLERGDERIERAFDRDATFDQQAGGFDRLELTQT